MTSSNRLSLKTSAAGIDRQLWIISSSSRTVVQATIQWLPDDSLDIHGIEVPDGSRADEREEAAIRLLTKAVRFASDRKMRFARFVDWTTDGILPAAAAEQAGFEIAGIIHEWQRATAPEESRATTSGLRRMTLTPQSEFHAVRCPRGLPTVTLDADTERGLMELLAGCIRKSDDLTGLPAPVPELIFRGWKALPGSVDVIIANSSEQDVGLGVISRSEPSRAATLEYLGVTHSARRQGHATRLIHGILASCFAEEQNARGVAGKTENAGIIAFCDSANAVAVDLYRRHGFTRGQAGTIYIRLI